LQIRKTFKKQKEGEKDTAKFTGGRGRPFNKNMPGIILGLHFDVNATGGGTNRIGQENGEKVGP